MVRPRAAAVTVRPWAAEGAWPWLRLAFPRQAWEWGTLAQEPAQTPEPCPQLSRAGALAWARVAEQEPLPLVAAAEQAGCDG